MPFSLFATGPETVEDLEHCLARQKKEHKPALAIKSKKQKKHEENPGLTDPKPACEACKTQATTGMPSLISQDWLCMPCIELEQAEQIRLDEEEMLWF